MEGCGKWFDRDVGAVWIWCADGRDTHPELLEGVRLPRGLPEQRDEVHAVALGLEVGHQTRGVLHLLLLFLLQLPFSLLKCLFLLLDFDSQRLGLRGCGLRLGGAVVVFLLPSFLPRRRRLLDGLLLDRGLRLPPAEPAALLRRGRHRLLRRLLLLPGKHLAPDPA